MKRLDPRHPEREGRRPGKVALTLEGSLKDIVEMFPELNPGPRLEFNLPMQIKLRLGGRDWMPVSLELEQDDEVGIINMIIELVRLEILIPIELSCS